MSTRWGLIVHQQTSRSEVRKAILEETAIRLLRVQVGPSVMRWDPQAAAALVRQTAGRGFDVCVGLTDSADDFLDPTRYQHYCAAVVDRAGARDYVLDAEWSNPEFGPGWRGYIETMAPVAAMIREVPGARTVGPGPTMTQPGDPVGELRRVLAGMEFDVPSLHAYPDKGWERWRRWLDDAESIFREFGYGEGWIGEGGVHGHHVPALDGGHLPCFSDRSASTRKQLDRARDLKAHFDDPQQTFWATVLWYQVFDRPGEDDGGIGYGFFTPRLEAKPVAHLFT